jgi:hypothetical protein
MASGEHPGEHSLHLSDFDVDDAAAALMMTPSSEPLDVMLMPAPTGAPLVEVQVIPDDQDDVDSPLRKKQRATPRHGLSVSDSLLSTLLKVPAMRKNGKN